MTTESRDQHDHTASTTGDCDERGRVLGPLSSRTLGRLATSVDGYPDIFPVNFVVQRRTILIRTAEGTKLAGVAINPRVAFEADDHDVAQGWSVVVKGQAQVVSGSAEMDTAERAQVRPWASTPKHRLIRIAPAEITGRRFRSDRAGTPVRLQVTPWAVCESASAEPLSRTRRSIGERR